MMSFRKSRSSTLVIRKWTSEGGRERRREKSLEMQSVLIIREIWERGGEEVSEMGDANSR